MSKSNTTPNKQGKTAATQLRKGASKENSARNIGIFAGVAVLILIAAVAIFMQRNSSAAAGLPAEVSVQQAHDLFQQGAFVLDVRTPEEWNESHVQGTTLIPLDQLAQRVNEVPKDQKVVVVCRSGNRSKQGRDILKNAGFTEVTSMSGGLKAWSAAGLPTVTGP